MTLTDLFPEGDQQSWPAATLGYHPNNVLTAQACQACGSLVEFGERQVHLEHHQRQDEMS